MTHINLFDRTLKIIGRNYADLLLQLAFPDIPARSVGTLENIELSSPVRPVDSVHRIEHAQQEYILHMEFQLEHEADFLIMAEPAGRKRADLLALAVTVASRYFDKAFLWQLFRKEIEQMKESSFVEDWIQEGIEQGRQTGTMKTQRENILQILQARFNISPQQGESWAQRLEAIYDPTRLKTLVDCALRDVTLTDFNTRLQNLPPAMTEQPSEQPHPGT